MIINNQQESVFPETHFASRLMNDFTGLVRRQKRELHKTIASKAATSFFDKSVLTITEFFEPIGFDLRIPAPVQPPVGSIKEFFDLSFGTKSPKNNKKIGHADMKYRRETEAKAALPLTIKRFFEPL